MGSSLNPAGIKKPSPGFILKADASLAPLNNAQIEVRAMSGTRAPSRFPPSQQSGGSLKAGCSPARKAAFRGFFVLLKGTKGPVNHPARSTHGGAFNFSFHVSRVRVSED